MLTGRTVIGIIAGAAIIALASASMVLDLTREALEVNETFDPGESTSFMISGDANSNHSLLVTAERFEFEMAAPGGGDSIPRGEFVGELSIDWVHEETGNTRISIQNTGSSQMVVSGAFDVPLDPILFAYHIIVITSGVVIIGFSLAFSLRKPRGF